MTDENTPLRRRIAPTQGGADRDTPSDSDVDGDENVTMRKGRPAPFQLSEHQLSSMLTKVIRETLSLSQATSPATPPCTALPPGNFSKCTARYSGDSGPDAVETFIDAVEIYKECAGVSDSHALRGLAMLLTDGAATWWRGIKAEVHSWDEAKRRLRGMFGTPQPAYKILRTIFAREQSGDSVDSFIPHIRALIAKLPYKLDICLQVDIIYELLDRKIRKYVPRNTINDIDTLLTKSREVEEARAEIRKPHSSTKDSIINKPNSKVNEPNSVSSDIDIQKRTRLRCSYCRAFNHSLDSCRKLAAKNEAKNSKVVAEGKPPIMCYQCLTPGVVRSRCDTCNGKKPLVEATTSSSFNVLNLPVHSDLPLVTVHIAGKQGVAVLDSGATQSLCSPLLYEVLINAGIKFSPVQRTISLAFGSPQVCNVLTTTSTVMVEIGGRKVMTEFMYLPSPEGKTLLGKDFISSAGIIMNIPQATWSFIDNPNHIFSFTKSFQLTSDTDARHVSSTDLLAKPLITRSDDNLLLRAHEGPALSSFERETLNNFISCRAERFAKEGPATEFATHSIKVRDDQPPIACPPYRLSPNRKAALREELDKLLAAGVIEECESPWAANVVMVPKKDGGMRLCIDYRKLNEVTVPDRYPLPRIEDVLHAAKTCTYMTTLDLHSGYFHVNVHPDDRDKTSFVTPFGMFRFIRMPMGLRNSGATFQRLIDRFKSNLTTLHGTVLAYLDDIIVLSPGGFENHIADLKSVFDRLAVFNLRVNREKSCFACSSVKFLGHIITPGGFHTDPDKTAAVTAMPAPKNVKHLMSFLQTSSWFRRFIPGYAEVARPLTALLKKNSKWQWGEEQQQAFERIKALLTSAPVLRQADDTLPYILRTDSSGYCLGAVLMQGEGTDERPIEYASRQLNTAERNYTTTEREALAVVWDVQKFRGYIEGAQVLVKSDHQPLRWLMNTKSPSGRLARWALILQEFDLRIEYTPGKSNVLADMLSRPSCSQDAHAQCDLCYAVADFPARAASDIRNNQLKDPEVRKIIDDLEADDVPFRGRQWADRGYVLSDGILYRYAPEADGDEACLVVPEHERAQVLAEYHDAPTAGHFGVERTLQRISAKYYFPGMRSFVASYIKSCVACQRYKADTRKPAGLVQTPVPARRFEVVSVDLFGPLPETANGNRWILIAEDVCTRWVELFALREATSLECAKTLVGEVFLRYGVVRRLVSDQGVQFVSEVMQQVCNVFGIQQSLTSYYHPEANPIERKNRDLKPQLAILVGKDHSTWDTFLPAIRFAMNSAITSSTGHSPAFLTFGREIRAPADAARDLRAIVDSDTFVASVTPYLRRLGGALAAARDVHERAQRASKEHADAARREVPEYDAGALVLLKTQGLNDTGKGQTAKFIPRRDGPYRIRSAVSPVTYLLERISDGALLGKYHTSQLTPFVGDVVPALSEKRKRGRPRRN